MSEFGSVRGLGFRLSVSKGAIRENGATSVLFGISRVVTCIDQFFALGVKSLLCAKAPIKMKPINVKRRLRKCLRNRGLLSFCME